jgi:hypothetical protein
VALEKAAHPYFLPHVTLTKPGPLVVFIAPLHRELAPALLPTSSAKSPDPRQALVEFLKKSPATLFHSSGVTYFIGKTQELA